MHKHSRTISALAIGVTLLLTATPALRADPPRFFEVDRPPRQWREGLVPVITESAVRLRVSEPGQALIMTHHHDAEHDLSIIALDDAGQLVKDSRHNDTLPVPKPLSDYRMHIVAAAAHPQKPLIYIWQDVARLEDNDPPDKLVHENLHHLLVYEITSDNQLELVQRAARGEMYDHRTSGRIALDWPRRRLYVGNTYGREGGDADGNVRPQAAYLMLDDNGRAVMENGAAKLTGQTGPWDGDERRWPDAYLPVRATGDRVILSEGHNLLAWDMTQDRYRFGGYRLTGAGHAGHVRFCMHPDKPLVYATFAGGDKVFRIRHADGLPTMLPQRMTVRNAELRSQPIITADGRTLIVAGDRERIIFITIDEDGWLTDDIETVLLSGGYQRRSALAYSAKFDLLYAQSQKPVPPERKEDGE